jgi:zinc transport system substrate-binding protein
VKRRVLVGTGLIAMAIGALAMAGCGGADRSGAAGAAGAGATAPLAVVASFYPLQEAAQRIGGSHVRVTDLTPVGGEPHDLELTPDRLAALERARLVLYLGHAFQPQVEKAVASLPSSARTLDLLDGVRLRPASTGISGVHGEVDGGSGEALAGGGDPHVWVDPGRFAAMAERVEAALIAADPAHRAAYERNGARYRAQLRALDAEFAQTLAACRDTVLVTSHAAFGYLTDRYGLTQAAIAGITPEAEPDPASLAALAHFASRRHVGTVYFETLVPRRLSQTLAAEIGAGTDALDPVEGLTEEGVADGADYVSIQRENLRRIARGLSCTG